MMKRVASFGVATPRAGAEPIIVGLIYRQAPGRDLGSHFSPSTATRAIINFSNSSGSNAGRAIRVAEIS
jgi:hypothetical protein